MQRAKLEFLGRRGKPPFILAKDRTTLGRGADNDVVFCDFEEDRVVSVHHCVLEHVDAGLRVRDLGASNKLLLNGREVAEAILADKDELQLGRRGPKLRVRIAGAPGRGLVAVTQFFLRERVGRRPYVAAIVALVLLAGAFAVMYAITREDKLALLESLRREGRLLEDSIAGATSTAERRRLMGRLNQIVLEREKVLASLPAAQRPARSFVEEEVVQLLQRFRETSYLVPELFTERVEAFVRYYTEDPRGRLDVQLGLRNGAAVLPAMRASLARRKLPEELAYVAFVESKLDPAADNPKTGARGLWQLRPETARELGLRVDEAVDERLDPVKSTRAARALILQLISTYGVRSFMLVLAAYNAGDARLRARLKRLDDPIEQRDFWTLVRLGVLREETNNYIPKFIAATIVFEHLDRYGFAPPGEVAPPAPAAPAPRKLAAPPTTPR